MLKEEEYKHMKKNDKFSRKKINLILNKSQIINLSIMFGVSIFIIFSFY